MPPADLAPPTLRDVLDARRLLATHLQPTPARTYPALDRATGAHVVVKHENHQPTGAFKVRGALNLLLRLTPDERAHGVTAFSTGNHAQAVAHAARTTATPCTIVMPTDPNPTKADAVRDLGARLVLSGTTFDDAREHATALAAEDRSRLVSAANEPLLVAGVATAYLELLADAPDLDVLVVPVGGGSGAAAACLVAQALAPGLEVVAVQSAASPAAHDSWRARDLVARPNTSRAEGLATGTGFALTQAVLREHLDDFVLVDDDTIDRAAALYLTAARTVAEGAGAAALAAVLADPDRFAGRRVGVVCSGGNASPAELRRVSAHLPR
ncbi:MAG: threonine ammonia-lyase [Cellulosimicrobium funkei]|uniref:threonine ammonia-lyase n=1 Tax=Cellulosimicrobium cellulans TaxID=1710 RepID=A0AAV5P7Q5_CELCE|nr:pyridoxal-phosphate dependent enzyme [Cellulosimicrobium cellulans]QDP75730.1 pyridoxal-phosphate dependent enzyme [Cellulosimicrobium cellulans]GLY58484.1 serine/threonine dehydratase [Cellulosimicrobium cellulans]